MRELHGHNRDHACFLVPRVRPQLEQRPREPAGAEHGLVRKHTHNGLPPAPELGGRPQAAQARDRVCLHHLHETSAAAEPGESRTSTDFSKRASVVAKEDIRPTGG
eukprot:CAMPEP_0180054716 /NCGR_PEP_ID=MMETSP0985-20121206/2972_1 /TAXON_ID=483367 /ORGANISM="non described non described, Strain CCMP 2436" /LENGTH=105 /DNA_ID=CAMNT_0021984321 /DNA_START=892 /DNA_END=1205 /DNA_ORIENTATION=-